MTPALLQMPRWGAEDSPLAHSNSHATEYVPLQRASHFRAGLTGGGCVSNCLGDSATALCRKPGGITAVTRARSPCCSTFRLAKNCFTSGSDPWPATEVSAV